MKKSHFTYNLPEHLIAQMPLADRAASRLLVMNKTTQQLQDKCFSDFVDLLNNVDLLVFNNTKVMPARLLGQKSTGGKVEILIERIISSNRAIAHVKASKSPKVGTVITLGSDCCCEVLSRHDDLFELQFLGIDVATTLDKLGRIPLPPYIKRSDNATDLERYQTIFAQETGAVAAPTAGLHFDEATLNKIKHKGIQTAFVTLHVGSGTFQPVRVDNLAEHIMHKEYYAVSQSTADAVLQTKARGGRVIAVGTTAVRALESASQRGDIKAGVGDTALFITPGYTFKAVDALLTNFHLSESTLLMLVSAFAGYEQVMHAYSHAIEQSYRFFSYGDAMFIAD